MDTATKSHVSYSHWEPRSILNLISVSSLIMTRSGSQHCRDLRDQLSQALSLSQNETQQEQHTSTIPPGKGGAIEANVALDNIGHTTAQNLDPPRGRGRVWTRWLKNWLDRRLGVEAVKGIARPRAATGCGAQGKGVLDPHSVERALEVSAREVGTTG